MRILIPDAPFTDDAAIERAAAGPDAAFDLFSGCRAEEIPDPFWQGCDGMICYNLRVGARILAKLSRCRVIVRAGINAETVDIETAGRHGIAVCTVPDFGCVDVADHAMASLLSLTRGISAHQERLRRHGAALWRCDGLNSVRRLTGAVFGVVGLGRIGLAVARRARAFDMPVLFYDPHLPSGIERSLGFGRMPSLPDLVHRADVMSLHAPLNARTRGMIGSDLLALAKTDQILINTAEGGLVDLDALFQAMKEDRIAAAALDVLPVEPPDFSHPLLAAWRAGEPWIADRLILTPHAGCYSAASLKELRRRSVDIAVDLLRSGMAANCVNQESLAAAGSGH